MRLKNLEIENFRCFRSSKLDLSADVVAIYGRNGVGKTAVFDAIEFALLGSIGRYEDESNSPDFIANTFSSEDARVRIGFENGVDEWVEVTRPRSEVGTITIQSSGSFSTHRDMLYEFLLDEDYLPARREIATVRELIRATLLLSQDSVREFVEGLPERRARIVANIAGSAFWQRCLDKARAVSEEARRRAKDSQSISFELETKANNERNRLKEVESRISSIRSQLGTASVTEVELREALIAAGVAVKSPSSVDPEALAATVRGTIDERLRFLQIRNQRLIEIELTIEEVPSLIRRSEQIEAEIISLRRERKNLHSQIDELKNRDSSLSSVSDRLMLDISKDKNQLTVLDEATSLAQERTIISKDLNNITQDLQRAEKSLSNTQEQLSKTQQELSSVDHQIMITKQATSQLEELLNGIIDLTDSIEPYNVAAAKSERLSSEIKDLTEKLQVVQDKLGSIQAQHSMLSGTISTVSKDLANAESSSKELVQMLNRIRHHAIDGRCPLCGHGHESLSALQGAIDKVLSNVPAEAKRLSQQLHDLSVNLATITTEIRSAEEEVRKTDRLLERKRTELAESKRFMASTNQKAQAMRVTLSKTTLESEINRLNKQIAESRTRLASQEEQREFLLNQQSSLIKNIELLQSQLASKRVDKNTKEKRITTNEVKIKELVATTTGRDIALPKLAKAIEQIRKRLTEKELERGSKSSQRIKIQGKLKELSNRNTYIDTRIKNLESEMVTLRSKIEEHNTKCRLLEVSELTNKSEIEVKKGDVLRHIDRMEHARRLTETYAAARRAVLLEKELENTQLTLQIAEEEHAHNQNTIRDFCRVKSTVKNWIDILARKVNAVVKERIDEHSSEIDCLFKMMIPNPYIFEGINIDFNDFGINLGLRYFNQTEDSGEPKFFLSTAQANVLALAIYLSFASKQRWSKLHALLLDDPVQHLDDLDALAFIDNLRACALGLMGQRKQIIISTCDKNLYLLMIRKFGLLEAQGLKFTGISLIERGNQGPDIIYDIGGRSDRRYLAVS
jgi:DNA repair exonuclease SbcCD ATPase subunit